MTFSVSTLDRHVITPCLILCQFVNGFLRDITPKTDISYTFWNDPHNVQTVINGKWRFSATWGSETPELIEVKFDTIDYVRHPTPQAKTGLRHFTGVRWG